MVSGTGGFVWEDRFGKKVLPEKSKKTPNE